MKNEKKLFKVTIKLRIIGEWEESTEKSQYYYTYATNSSRAVSNILKRYHLYNYDNFDGSVAYRYYGEAIEITNTEAKIQKKPMKKKEVVYEQISLFDL